MGAPRNHLPLRRAICFGRAQRGQAVPLVVVVLLLLALTGAGLVRVAGASAERAATQAAADASALAGANDGQVAAERLAWRNGAVLVVYEEVDLDVLVTVRRGRFTAHARARWTATPAEWRSGGGSRSRRVP